MKQWQWKVFSILTILAMALALCPPGAVRADYTGDGTITGIIALNISGRGFRVSAYPVGGSDRHCISDWVNWDSVNHHYDYSISGCDHTLNYTLVADGSGFTFNDVSVLSADFTETSSGSGVWVVGSPQVPDITPVDRVFSIWVMKPNGDGWPNFEVNYELNGTPATGITDNTGKFTIPGVTDASQIHIPRFNDMDGYNFDGGDRWWDPPLRENPGVGYTARGTRSFDGYVDTQNGTKACRGAVTITATGGDFSGVFTNDPGTGPDVVLNVSDTSGFKVDDTVVVSSLVVGSEITTITAVTDTSVTVANLSIDQPANGNVTLPASVTHVFTNDPPSSGDNIVLNMSNTGNFKVGDSVTVSSTDGTETTTITAINADISITVAHLNTNHTANGEVKLTVAATLTQTTLTDADGGYSFNNLEPVIYSVSASRSGCVFTPEEQTVNIRNGNGRRSVAFLVPNTGIWGRVNTTLSDSAGIDRASLAYYLIATYTTDEGVKYSNAVNWAGGDYWIPAPPSSGTLTISRVGGPAAFGYDTGVVTTTTPDHTYISGPTQSISLTDGWKQVNFTLIPNRTISGTIKDPNGVPVQKDATVDFGYWLKWRPTTPTYAYQLKAQPKLYYLSPVENGILSSTPVRFMANLTTLPAVTGANFTLNLKTYVYEGCLGSDFDWRNNILALPAGSVRFQPATGYGTVTYPASIALDSQNCGPNSYYYKVTLPKGIAGNMVVDNHTLRGDSIDGVNWDENNKNYSLFGDRTITGHIYAANPNLWVNWDLNGGGILQLYDATTNNHIQASGDFERSWEFTIPMLERKTYKLGVNPYSIPNGYDTQPTTMAPIIPVNLTPGDVDVPGLVLVHKPIDPFDPDRPSDGYTGRPATGGGFFQAATTTQTVQWAYPPMNNRDWDRFQGFYVQVAPAVTAGVMTSFTDSSPAPTFIPSDDNPSYTFGVAPAAPLTPGTLYRWRVRAVYEYDKGPWLETTPVPTAPANWSARYAGVPALVNFSWRAVGGVPSARYIVQYSESPTFAVATTLPFVTGTSTTATPATAKTIYWRVKVQNAVGVDISGWSPTQVFFNGYSNLTGPTFTWESFGWNPNPVHFNVTNPNNPITNPLPPNAYYQVELHHNDGNPDTSDYYYWTFPVGSPSVRQFPDSLRTGTFTWKIRIVVGNEYYPDFDPSPYTAAVTDWTPGALTINVP